MELEHQATLCHVLLHVSYHLLGQPDVLPWQYLKYCFFFSPLWLFFYKIYLTDSETRSIIQTTNWEQKIKAGDRSLLMNIAQSVCSKFLLLPVCTSGYEIPDCYKVLSDLLLLPFVRTQILRLNQLFQDRKSVRWTKKALSVLTQIPDNWGWLFKVKLTGVILASKIIQVSSVQLW